MSNRTIMLDATGNAMFGDSEAPQPYARRILGHARRKELPCHLQSEAQLLKRSLSEERLTSPCGELAK
ncbi:hypothetical protein HBI56_051480 [Parastagonospora nodorum]|uniref:Uncharacterized protein n=1 Tax=Phaeosphaeria nodorum (strain SN15 / ATCC MYA-4574 / FGSC 10173) TaxID=321614 RepID=A0A7U2NR67_PHANO|nr:hypothetical protein HBH56_100680 [Parastagonospora nodorum]QRD07545.1 hypothetical protein JI435_424560 [Parastagonospora nodorum SN15]KAH3930149.1 hypothetical protein HBH54_115000 [Parastagonospora nodorum]KAH3942819.1 hypothetical protein HBH53_180800 [Parastagonospora nodorum]KAH3964466.1 hypothetical protein HBH51_157070 [Parastagonospora nodorum]